MDFVFPQQPNRHDECLGDMCLPPELICGQAASSFSGKTGEPQSVQHFSVMLRWSFILTFFPDKYRLSLHSNLRVTLLYQSGCCVMMHTMILFYCKIQRRKSQNTFPKQHQQLFNQLSVSSLVLMK